MAWRATSTDLSLPCSVFVFGLCCQRRENLFPLRFHRGFSPLVSQLSGSLGLLSVTSCSVVIFLLVSCCKIFGLLGCFLLACRLRLWLTCSEVLLGSCSAALIVYGVDFDAGLHLSLVIFLSVGSVACIYLSSLSSQNFPYGLLFLAFVQLFFPCVSGAKTVFAQNKWPLAKLTEDSVRMAHACIRNDIVLDAADFDPTSMLPQSTI